MNLAPGSSADRYTVVGLLGQGGMASVYLVTHRHLGSSHVLKVLSLPGSQIAERLMREGQVQARLKHPNVVEVTDVVQIHGAPGLVMELVRGPALDEVLTAVRIPLELSDALVPGILAGVAAAHDVGVVHRDLKPANILLAMRRSTLRAKVADFGLVKLAEGSESGPATKTGATMGTPQYMAPEQIQSARDVDSRADIFALGAILYELVTGQRAFDGETTFDVFSKVVDGAYTPVQQLCPEAPQRMVDAIDSALSPLESRPADIATLWSTWSAGTAGSLEEAAAVPVACTTEMTTMLESIAPELPVPSMESIESIEPAPPTIDAGTSAETFIDLPPVEPSRPVSSAGTSAGLVGCGALGALGLVGLLLLGVGGLYLSVSGPASPPPVPVEQPEPEPEPKPDPVTPPPPAPPVPATKPTAPAPGPAPAKPPPQPEPVEPPPVEPAAPDPTGMATVTAVGAARVTLLGGGRSFSPGQVPAGDYNVVAYFPDAPEKPEPVFNLTLVEGQAVTVTCKAKIRRCNQR